MPKFLVTVPLFGEATVEVSAVDKKEAIDKAMDVANTMLATNKDICDDGCIDHLNAYDVLHEGGGVWHACGSPSASAVKLKV